MSSEVSLSSLLKSLSAIKFLQRLLVAPAAFLSTTSLSGAAYFFAVGKVSDGGRADDQTEFEVAYSYTVNNNVTIKPGFCTVEETTPNEEDDRGVVLETTFSF